MLDRFGQSRRNRRFSVADGNHLHSASALCVQLHPIDGANIRTDVQSFCSVNIYVVSINSFNLLPRKICSIIPQPNCRRKQVKINIIARSRADR